MHLQVSTSSQLDSIVAATGQGWKRPLLLLPLLAVPVAVKLGLVEGVAPGVAVGLFLAMNFYLYRCPRCRGRWGWMSIAQRPSGEALSFQSEWQMCPSCGLRAADMLHPADFEPLPPGTRLRDPRRLSPLELGCVGDFKFKEPTQEQLFDGLRALGADDGSFLILTDGDDNFMRCCRTSAGFDVEYREVPAERHFRSRREDHSLAEAELLFAAYRAGDPAFRDLAPFELAPELSG